MFADDSYQIAHTDKDFVYYFVPREGCKGKTDIEAVVISIKEKFKELKENGK